MDHAAPAGAGHAGSDGRCLRIRAPCLWTVGWLLRGAGDRDGSRTVRLHAFHDSRRLRGSLADPGHVGILGDAAVGPARGVALLESGGFDGPERAHQEPDRAGVSRPDYSRLSAADPSAAVSGPNEAALKRGRVCAHRRSLARSGGTPESGSARHPGKRLSLVLLHQRTVPAVSQRADSARLRHGAAAAVLAAGPRVGVSLGGVSAGCRARAGALLDLRTDRKSVV